MENNQKTASISYLQLKEEIDQLIIKLSAEPNDSKIPSIFTSMISKINQYSIPYAVLMLSNDFIQVIIQIYFEEAFNTQINTLLTSLFEVFNYEMFSESPTVSILSQLKEFQICIPLTSPRKEINHIEKLYDTMRSLELQWKMIKEMKKEDESIEANIRIHLIESLDICYKMLKELPSNTLTAVTEYFNEYYAMLTLFKDNSYNNNHDNDINININQDNINEIIYPNEFKSNDEYIDQKNRNNNHNNNSKVTIKFPQSMINDINNRENVEQNYNNKGFNSFVQHDDVSKIELHKRTFFYINEVLKAEESIDIEFKNYYYPFQNHLFEEIRKQICGFLNCKGGRLYIGIKDNQIVNGLVLNYKARDLVRNQIVNCTSDFFPKCRTNKIKVFFIPIKTKRNVYIKNLYVIKVIIRQGDQGRLYSLSSKVYCSYLRMPGQCVSLSANEIYDEIIKRHTDIIDINNINDDQIDDKVYDDPEPDIPIDNNNNNNNNQSNNVYVNKPQVYVNNSNGKHLKKKFITVKIDNISKNCTEKELDEVFKLTSYCSKKIFSDEKGSCLGWAFFNYKSEEEAAYAIDLLKNVELKGKKLEFQLRK